MTKRGFIGQLIRPGTTSWLLLVGSVIAGVLLAPNFVSTHNIQSLMVELVAPSMLAIVVAVAMLGGVVDISIASVFGLGGVAYAWALDSGSPVALAMAVAAGAGLVAGVVNSVVSVRFGVPPLVATLGMYVAARGAVRVISGGRSVAAFRPELSRLIERHVGPVPVIYFAVIVAGIVVGLAMRHARWARHIVATGASAPAAARRGIATNRIKVVLFVLAGGAAALAGVVQTVRLGTAPVNLGEGLEFEIYAALLVAGFRLSGLGSGTVVNGLVCVAGLGCLLNIVRLRGMPLPSGDILLGATLLAAAIVDVGRGWRPRRTRAAPAPAPAPPGPGATAAA